MGSSDLVTAFLGLSPGGASEMAAAALDFHADAGVVAALHMVRQISVFLTIPLVFKLAGLGRPQGHSGSDVSHVARSDSRDQGLATKPDHSAP